MLPWFGFIPGSQPMSDIASSANDTFHKPMIYLPQEDIFILATKINNVPEVH